MTNENLTAVILVLDRSSSMFAVRGETIEGVNNMIEDQKEGEGDALFYMVSFASAGDYQVVNEWSDMKSVRRLTSEDYEPSGLTALMDATVKTIDDVGRYFESLPEEKRPGKIVFAIMTDGHENNSQHASIRDMNSKIEHQKKKYNWQFLYLGANQNAIDVAQAYGIHPSKAMTYGHSGEKTQSAIRSFSGSIRRARMAHGAMISNSIAFTAEDRKSAAPEGDEIHYAEEEQK